MKGFWALPAFLRLAIASQQVFSVQDDVLAYPQFQVDFLEDDHVSESLAQSRMASKNGLNHDLGSHSSDPGEIALKTQHDGKDFDHGGSENNQYEYDILNMGSQRYLCQIPHVEPPELGETNTTISKAEEEMELARANDRGWALLEEMQGNCIYYWSGWWSYSYCFGHGVKQFHQLPARPGVPPYPPVEDPNVAGFVLGFTESGDKNQEETGLQDGRVTEEQSKAMGSLETRGDNRYLVQKLGGGTVCDLTGKDRRVEVQFHCNPAFPDRISLIKEVATCAYLMVIQTPRLCNDVAFLPPQKDSPNLISCTPILSPEEVPAYRSEVANADASAKAAVGERIPNPFGTPEQSESLASIGGITVGARKWIPEGKEIEKTAIVGGGKETYIETIADSFGKLLSPEQLVKMGLGDPKTVERLKKELDKIAGDKEWKLEVFDTPRGKQYRGVIGDDDDVKGEDKGNEDGKGGGSSNGNGDKEEEEGHEGSEEEYKAKDEL